MVVYKKAVRIGRSDVFFLNLTVYSSENLCHSVVSGLELDSRFCNIQDNLKFVL